MFLYLSSGTIHARLPTSTAPWVGAPERKGLECGVPPSLGHGSDQRPLPSSLSFFHFVSTRPPSTSSHPPPAPSSQSRPPTGDSSPTSSRVGTGPHPYVLSDIRLRRRPPLRVPTDPWKGTTSGSSTGRVLPPTPLPPSESVLPGTLTSPSATPYLHSPTAHVSLTFLGPETPSLGAQP